MDEGEDTTRRDRLRDGATRWFSGLGGATAAAHLAALPEEVEADRYGDGGVVAELEAEVADVLGHERAVLMPTGTLAQAIALRLHAEDAGCRAVAMHPTAHPLQHEADGLAVAHGLDVHTLGDGARLPTPEDLAAVTDPLAAVLVELPVRELGGWLHPWEDLVALVQAIRDRGAAAHLDGARLWECEPAYGRDAAEIAGLFDTVYVSLYKGLGGLGGACLAGPADLMARAVTWRHRLGGRPIGLWPWAASGLVGLRTARPAMGARLEHLRAVAAALADLSGVEVVPDPPEAALCRLYLHTTPTAFDEVTEEVAAHLGVWAWGSCQPTERPDWQVVELHASDNLLAFTPDEVRTIVARYVAGPSAASPSASRGT